MISKHIVIITDVDKMREYARIENIKIPDNVSRGGLFCRGCGGYLPITKKSSSEALALYSKEFRRQHNGCSINTTRRASYTSKRGVDHMCVLS